MTQNTKDNAFRDKVVYGVLAALIIFVAQKFMEPLFENREKDKDKTETTAAKISPAKNQVAINKYEAFLTIADKELRKPEPDYSYAKKLYSDAVILAKKH